MPSEGTTISKAKSILLGKCAKWLKQARLIEEKNLSEDISKK